MTSGSCPRCRSALEEDASFCHSCGLDLASAVAPSRPIAMPAPGPGGAVIQPGMAPFPMFPTPGLEVPVNPLGHERAMAAMASVIIFFTASVVFFFALVYMVSRAISYEDEFVDGVWRSGQTINWEWVLASSFMFASFGAGVAGGIAAVKAVRFPLAMVSSVLIVISTMILLFDHSDLTGESATQIAFMLVLSLSATVLLYMARSSFKEPAPKQGRGPPAYAVDNYGWSVARPPGGAGP